MYAEHRLVLTVADGDVKNPNLCAQSLHAANGSLVAVEVGRVELGGKSRVYIHYRRGYEHTVARLV